MQAKRQQSPSLDPLVIRRGEITTGAGSELPLWSGRSSKPIAPADNKFHQGNGEDGKHYWLVPPSLYAELDAEFHFTFDPCPYPRPEGFDGLTCEWGAVNWVNPPFGSIMHEGKKKGPTAWMRKAIAEQAKGRTSVVVYPVDKWVLMMLKATGAANVRNLGDVRWHAIEDGSQGKGTGRHIAAFILHGHELKECVSELPKGKDSPRHDATDNAKLTDAPR